MNVNLSWLSPYLWLVAAVLAIIVAFIIIRFFWQHLLKYIVQGCLAIVVIVILIAILKYFKVF
ncbi:MAG: hypothetical protein ABSF99_09215 [Anaerolineales bacterium]|jgi:hypothetical protein